MKNLFLNVTLTVLVIFSVTAHAENWQKILSCENGAATVDVDTNDRQHLQLVLRGNDLLSKLHNAKMISLNYGQQEYIISGQHAQLSQLSPTVTGPVPLPGVFYASDFKKLIWQNWSGDAMEVEARGSELVLKKLYYTQGQSCPDWNDSECRGGTDNKTYYFVSEYILKGCDLQ
jgi:hypothetical protein